jgi:hypothetical protein
LTLPAFQDPGVTDDEVKSAVSGDHLGEHRLDGGFIRDINRHRRVCAPPGLVVEALRRLSGAVAVEIRQDDLRARRGEAPGDFEAESLGPAGDDGDTIGHDVASRFDRSDNRVVSTYRRNVLTFDTGGVRRRREKEKHPIQFDPGGVNALSIEV